MESVSISARRILKSHSFVFLAAVLLVLAVIAVMRGGSDTTDDQTLKAVASASPGVVRVGDEVSFSAMGSKGDIASFQWEFGDGTMDNGTDVIHAFEEGGWFDVKLTVETNRGAQANTTVRVGVQPEDVANVRVLERERDVRPFYMHGPGLLGTVGPHIAAPTSHLTYHVVRAFGTFDIYVEVWVWAVDRYERTSLYSDSLTMTGNDLDFSYTVEPEDLPDEAATNGSMVHIYAMIDQGRWGGGEITVDVEFPFDELIEEGDGG